MASDFVHGDVVKPMAPRTRYHAGPQRVS
eukprot:COSAG02_NODE_67578_length_252_cov_1.326797_1_plen_28_part_10